MIFFDEVKKFKIDRINNALLFETIANETEWDKSMKSRWTASYGVPYNYNESVYYHKDIPENIKNVLDELEPILSYRPNNCLINFYNSNSSKMGFHSDNINILEENTGITILSLGANRKIKFQNIIKNDYTHEIDLEPGSILHMSSELQKYWKHAILPCEGSGSIKKCKRISLTFRKIKE